MYVLRRFGVTFVDIIFISGTYLLRRLWMTPLFGIYEHHYHIIEGVKITSFS